MPDPIQYRPAVPEDSRFIAEMIAISSDGIASLEWQQQAEKEKIQNPLDIGAQCYAQDEGDYSYKNCLIAEIPDDQLTGMILSFPINQDNYSRDAKPPPYKADEIYAPYMYLEALNSWYICGVTVLPEHRRRGIARNLIEQSIQQGKKQGYQNTSLVAMYEKSGLIHFYQSLGFIITRTAPVVEHPAITAKGQAVLMETHPTP